VATGTLASIGDATRKSLADVAYERLRDRLLMLEIKPGDILNDEQLAKELEVGRTPVREALKRLELDRLVITYPRRGTFATRVEVTDLAFISEIRAQLKSEGYATQQLEGPQLLRQLRALCVSARRGRKVRSPKEARPSSSRACRTR